MTLLCISYKIYYLCGCKCVQPKNYIIMNRFFRLLFVALCAVTTLCGCEKNTDNVAPTVSVTLVEVGSTSAKISIQAKNADEYAYMLYDGDAISVERVFNEGVTVKEIGNGLGFGISNLEPETTYYVIAAARNSIGETLSEPVKFTTAKSGDNGGNGDNGNNDNNDNNTELPDIDGVENITITKTQDGRWYEPFNYYVTLVRDNGDRIILDFYTLDETMSSYLPYGQYSLGNSYDPFIIHSESSGYIPAGVADGNGYNFTDGYVSVDVANGYYSIYFMLTYDANGTSKSIQGLYNGLMSGAAVPEGDNQGAKKLIEVLDVGSTSFKFRVNAEEGQYWRCSVVDKRVYDQTASNPGAWVVTYGFMLDGTRTFDWRNGEMCEHVPGYMMNVSSSTDYLILVALMDYSEGQENNLLGGVEIVQVHTEAEAEGKGSVQVEIKEINRNDIVFDCMLGDDVWCCYVAMMETANLQEIKDGKYALAGYNSYEECMLSLIPGLSHDSMRQFLESQVNYKWDYLKYTTSYTMCIKVVDMDNGVRFIELEPFTTK